MIENDWIDEYLRQWDHQMRQHKLFYQSEIGQWCDEIEREARWGSYHFEETKLLSGIEEQFWILYEPLDDDIPY